MVYDQCGMLFLSHWLDKECSHIQLSLLDRCCLDIYCAEMFNLCYSDRLQELCFVLIFVGHQKLSLILNVADMRQ